jgi:hypothetical protein
MCMGTETHKDHGQQLHCLNISTGCSKQNSISVLLKFFPLDGTDEMHVNGHNVRANK